MTLQEALARNGVASKHITDEVPGTYLISKATMSGGYYKDFQPDDPKRRSAVNTSAYWGTVGYDGRPVLETIASFAGNEGWEPR